MFQTEAPAANTALILSLIGLLSCMCGPLMVLPPVALGFAIQAKRQIARNPNLQGGNKATIALVLSIIECVILAGIIVVAIFIAVYGDKH